MNEQQPVETDKPNPREVRPLALDVMAMEARTAGYPDNIRNATMWLAGFVRNRCNRDLRSLADMVKKSGFETTHSTLSKILRGYWNMDVKGNKVAPAMSEKNLLQLVDKLRAEEKLVLLDGGIPFIDTFTWRTIKDYIDIRRTPARVCKFGLIAGPTGAQKSRSFKEYVARDEFGWTIHVESPAKGRFGEFKDDLANQLGFPRGGDTLFKEMQIKKAINHGKCIIVDNVQRLYRKKDGWHQNIFNYLQKLQDDTNCCVIMSATLDFVKDFTGHMDLGYFEQFEGRCGGRKQILTLPEYTPMEDIVDFAKAYGLVDYEQHLKYLEKITRERGRVRILLNSLQEAKQLAQATKSPLTIELLREVRGDSNAVELKEVA